MIVVVDYGLGNVHSVAKAFEAIGQEVCISKDPVQLREADRIVLPGVGAFETGIQNLRAEGLAELLTELVLEKKKPFLGICLGMQILAREGLEKGRHSGLGWIPGIVRRFDVESQGLRVPHVGWNEIMSSKGSSLFKGLPTKPIFYFVHSYHLVCDDPSWVAATCDYGYSFCAAVEKGNIVATQFHPEKSQTLGLRFLENFVRWQPAAVPAAA